MVNIQIENLIIYISISRDWASLTFLFQIKNYLFG